MKWIEKRQEPEGFSSWKNQANENWIPTWGGLSNPEKSELHYALLEEQGYICCYCNDRIGKPLPKSHIEHIKSRKHFASEALDYTNLACSCQGENDTHKPIHCGPAKAAWPDVVAYESGLFISPTDKECENAFGYTGIGQIIPIEGYMRQQAAEATIKHLRLDVPKLDAARRLAIEGILENIEDFSDEELRKLIAYFNTKDEDGVFSPFCSAIVYVLSRFLR